MKSKMKMKKTDQSKNNNSSITYIAKETYCKPNFSLNGCNLFMNYSILFMCKSNSCLGFFCFIVSPQFSVSSQNINAKILSKPDYSCLYVPFIYAVCTSTSYFKKLFLNALKFLTNIYNSSSTSSLP